MTKLGALIRSEIHNTPEKEFMNFCIMIAIPTYPLHTYPPSYLTTYLPIPTIPMHLQYPPTYFSYSTCTYQRVPSTSYLSTCTDLSTYLSTVPTNLPVPEYLPINRPTYPLTCSTLSYLQCTYLQNIYYIILSVQQNYPTISLISRQRPLLSWHPIGWHESVLHLDNFSLPDVYPPYGWPKLVFSMLCVCVSFTSWKLSSLKELHASFKCVAGFKKNSQLKSVKGLRNLSLWRS